MRKGQSFEMFLEEAGFVQMFDVVCKSQLWVQLHTEVGDCG